MPAIAADVYHVTIFGIKLEFDRVAFTIPVKGGWNIYWYGILIALGFLLAVIYCFKNAKKYDIDVDRLTDVVLVTTPVAIICARLYYILFGDVEIHSFADFVGFSGDSGVSGLAIYGGVIGAVLCGLLMCKVRKVNPLDAFDIAAPGFLIGQAIGRWGNFFNQEAFGTLLKHGMRSEGVYGYVADHIDQYPSLADKNVMDYMITNHVGVHPCFLYESIWCIIGFVLIHFLSKKRKFKGQMILSYGVWYGLGRLFIEGLRTDSLYLGPIRVSQWLSGALVLVCGGLLIFFLTKKKQAKVNETYVAMFDDIDPTTMEGGAEETEEETSDTEEPEEDLAPETDTEADTEETSDKADGESKENGEENDG